MTEEHPPPHSSLLKSFDCEFAGHRTKIYQSPGCPLPITACSLCGELDWQAIDASLDRLLELMGLDDPDKAEKWAAKGD